MPINGNDTKKDLPQKGQIPQSNTVIFNFYLHLQTPTNQAFTQIELYLICQRYKIKSKSQLIFGYTETTFNNIFHLVYRRYLYSLNCYKSTPQVLR